MNLRIDQKQETRRRILGSAAEAIRERGLGAPSVVDVMKGAGLTVGGFYAHFENKDALMLEALARLMNERMDELLALVPVAKAPERRNLTARWYLSRKQRDGGIDQRCPLPAVLGEVSRLDPRYREVLAEHISRWADAMRDDDEAQGRATALSAIATMIGAQTLARALGNTPFSDEILAAAKSAIAQFPSPSPEVKA